MTMLGNITDSTQVRYSLQAEPHVKLGEGKAFDMKEARQAAEDFEAFFITTTLESMFDGVAPNSVTGGGSAEKIFRSMLFNEYGKLMAKSGTIGVSDQVMSSILAMQEMSSQGYVTAK